MRARLIVISRIGGKNSPQVRLAEDDHVVQALAPQCPDHPFGNTILLWRSRRNRPVADAHRPNPGSEGMPIGPVIIAYEVMPGERSGDLCRLHCFNEVGSQLTPQIRAVIPSCREMGGSGRSHSPSFDHRRRPETLRTAMATAFFCPTNTTSRFPRVTPVYRRFRCSMV